MERSSLLKNGQVNKLEKLILKMVAEFINTKPDNIKYPGRNKKFF